MHEVFLRLANIYFISSFLVKEILKFQINYLKLF